MIYGHDKTIHRTGFLDVETRDGKVVSVWFRCMALPFTQIEVDQNRAGEMERAYETYNRPKILAIETED